jgi:hypothetical protein
MEDERRRLAETEAASRRATDAQVLEDAERLIAAWNERQEKRMPMLYLPTIGAAILARYWFLWVRCPACRTINAIDLALDHLRCSTKAFGKILAIIFSTPTRNFLDRPRCTGWQRTHDGVKQGADKSPSSRKASPLGSSPLKSDGFANGRPLALLIRRIACQRATDRSQNSRSLWLDACSASKLHRSISF